MNYESEKTSLVDRLKQNNQAALSQMENEPYRPVVYALTENQLRTLTTLLEQAAEFQPELYEQISVLATQEKTEWCFTELQRMTTDWAEDMVRMTDERSDETLRQTNQILSKMTERISQDGKNHDAFVLKLSAEMEQKTEALDSVISDMRRRILQILCGTALVSVLLSLAVCLLLRG